MTFPRLESSSLDIPTTSNLPTLIVLHGIGNQDPSWINEVLDVFPPSLSSRCVPFFWTDLFTQSPAGKIATTLIQLISTFTPIFTPLISPTAGIGLQSVINAGVQYIAVPWLNQWLDKSADILAYNSVRQKAFKRLNALIEEAPHDVVLVAHSMGSVLAFEFLQSDVISIKKVIRFVSLGSPLDRQPIKCQVLQRTQGKTSVPCPWINLWGTLDLVCCWQPWKSGELETFQPSEQLKIPWQAHHLSSYVRHIPLQWLND